MQQGFVRVHLSGSASLIGAFLPARAIGASANGGYFCAPVRIPAELDPAQPVSVTILVSPQATSLVDGQAAVLRLSWTRIRGNTDQQNDTLEMAWPIPDGWLAGTQRVVLFDNGNDRTFEAGYLQPGDWLGLQVTRQGTAAADTFAQTILVAETTVAAFEVT
jgi:hypothetical protein